MRKIKFRGKTAENKWVYGFLCQYDIIPEETYRESCCGYLEEQRCYEVIHDSIGQFTGLKDKNGKEIYEGDIIKAKTCYYGKEREIVYKVDFNSNIENDSFGEPLTMGYCLQGFSYEVIGNIYDNPELLK